MILVRDVFRMKFGKAREVKSLLDEMKKLQAAAAGYKPRFLFDLVGPSYTLAMESTFNNLADFESNMGKVMSAPEWRDWYTRFSSNLESSYREIFTIYE